MHSDLKTKTFKGFLWSGYQKIGSMGLSFLANIILARILTPSDFGCIGMIMVFVNISSVFIDAGFGSAIIQKRNTSDKDYSTVFFWNIGISLVLYALLYVSAPLIGSFYEIPKLSSYLRVLGLILIFNSLSLVQTTILKKELEFKLLANCYIISSIISVAITLWVAYHNYNVWSLVVYQIVLSICNSTLVWIFTKWRPTFNWSWKSFRELFSFGGYLLLSSIIGTVSKQLQSLLIGKMCSTVILGYYTQARNLESAPTNVIYSVIGQVTFPVFSANQNSKNDFNNVFEKVQNGVAFIIFPLMSLLVVIAEPLFVFIFTEKWIESVPYFQLLCIVGTIMPLIDIACFAISALGCSKLIFKWSVINNLICIIMLLVGSLWSIYGIIVSYILYSVIILINYSILIKRQCGIRLRIQFSRIVPLWLFCFILTGTIFLINHLYDISYIYLIPEVIFYILSYIAIAYTFKMAPINTYKRMIDDIMRWGNHNDKA